MAGWGYVYDDEAETWTVLGQPAEDDRAEVDSGQSAVWADGSLILFGGFDTSIAHPDLSGLSNDAWVWTP